MHIQFIFTRHGYSCSNYIDEYNKINDIKMDKSQVLDPILTDVGILEAMKLNKFMKQHKITPDIILCSKLKRAIESAAMIYKDVKTCIYPVSFINEISASEPESENTLSCISDIQNYIKTTDISPIIDFTLSDYLDKYLIRNGFRMCDIDIPSFENFIKYIVPFIVKFISRGKINYKKTYRIAVVSHYVFLMKHFNTVLHNSHNMNTLNNLDTWVEDVHIQQLNDELKNIDFISNKLVKMYSGSSKKSTSNITRCFYHDYIRKHKLLNYL